MCGMAEPKKIVIVDLDGTLADGTHREHHLKCDPRDWDGYYSKCSGDTPIREIIELVQLLAIKYEIWILTGRRDDTRLETVDWLREYHIPYSRLFMREHGDFTQDNELKLAWVDQAGVRDRVHLVLEDRQRVVDAWRQNGFRCIQVASGNF